MNYNERIVASAYKAASGRIVVPDRAGLCLALARIIIEHALYGGRREFYGQYLVAGTTRRLGTPEERLRAAKIDPWASDIESSMKRLGRGIPFLLRQPGDLVFNYRAAEPYGHVGVLLDRNTVLENISPAHRPTSIHLPNYLSITPLTDRPWTLVARVR